MIDCEYTNSQIEAIINEHIHSERDRAILKSRYIDGLTYERLAEKFDISPRNVKNIVYKNEWKILKHIK